MANNTKMQQYRKLEERIPAEELYDLNKMRERELKQRDMKYFWKKMEDDKNVDYDLGIDGRSKKIVLSLSWNKNIKSVVNWMKNHMEAFPETRGGFLVEFIDDENHVLYRVDPCAKGGKGNIKINWVNYMIEWDRLSNKESIKGDLYRNLNSKI